jgi:hypothetical protein
MPRAYERYADDVYRLTRGPALSRHIPALAAAGIGVLVAAALGAGVYGLTSRSVHAPVVGGLTSPSPSPSTLPVPPPAGPVVTDENNGQTIHISVGETLWVELRGNGFYNWTTPATDDPRGLPRTGTSCPPAAPNSAGTACAAFRGAAAGQAHVTATGTPKCYPQCLAPSRLYEITVIVS